MILTLPQLPILLKEWNEPAYRAKQIWQGLYQHLYNTPEQFTNLPKSLREKLAENFVLLSFHSANIPRLIGWLYPENTV